MTKQIMNYNNIPEDPTDYIFQEDLNYIANAGLSYEELKNATILITGATGLIGSALVKALLCCNRINNLNIKVIALIRNMPKAQQIYGHLCERQDLSFIISDIIEPIITSESIDYIFHTASVTSSKTMIAHPVDTIKTAVLGTINMLEFARKSNIKGFVYLSSMEVYGNSLNENEVIREENLGYIDISNVRSCYPESKRICEMLCVSYVNEYNLNIKIARLAQTFGAGILPAENRVFAQFAKSVINRKNIVLHTKGDSEGNYCYLRDAIIAMFVLLFHGNAGKPYNIANEESHTTIREMAEMVANEIAKGEIKVIFDIPKSLETYGYAPNVKLKLDTSKIRALGWRPEISLKESYERMILSIENKNYQ